MPPGPPGSPAVPRALMLGTLGIAGTPVVSTLRLKVGCHFVHRLETPIPAVLQVEPRRDGAFTVLRESLDVPGVPTLEYLDIYGNTCRRLVMPAGESAIRYDAVVEVPDEVDPSDEAAVEPRVDDLPDETLLFTLPSRLCPSDELGTTAWRMFGGIEPGWHRVQGICDWVHDNIEFRLQSSTPQTTATAVFLQRAGVCRDFAQLAISFCRALNIPARYVFGYLPDIGVPLNPDPMDFCAWFEAYLGDRWWTFDPRNNQRRRGRVVIGIGRDAVDVAMLTSYGTAPLVTMTVWADQVAAETEGDA
jgi:transglutaminase-like putative cysteine protease